MLPAVRHLMAPPQMVLRSNYRKPFTYGEGVAYTVVRTIVTVEERVKGSRLRKESGLGSVIDYYR